MAKTNIGEQIERGGVILERLGKRPASAGLKAYVAAFKTEYGRFEKANEAAGEARQKRDEALALVGAQDDVLDADVDALATEMVGAKMGKRSHPFQGFSKHAPGKLVRLPYAVEVEEVHKLVAAVAKAKPAAAVAKAAAKCKKSAESVQAALDGLTHPQTVYNTAMAARDALLPACVKALSKLKTQAKAAWDDEPGVYEAIFAPPERVQAPKKTRAKKTATKGAQKGAGKGAGVAPAPDGGG